MDTTARERICIIAFFVSFIVVGWILTLTPIAAAAQESHVAVAADDDTDLFCLAEQAKAAFRRRMEPPAILINVVDIMVRDQTAILRDYARESYEAAVPPNASMGRGP